MRDSLTELQGDREDDWRCSFQKLSESLDPNPKPPARSSKPKLGFRALGSPKPFKT